MSNIVYNTNNNLVAEIAHLTNPRNLQIQDSCFLGNIVMLVMGVLAVVLSVFFISCSYYGFSIVGVYCIGGIGLSVGLVLSGVALWMLHSAFIQRIAVLRKHTRTILRCSPNEILLPPLSKPEKKPIISLLCPQITNSEINSCRLSHPFSLKRQVIRILSIVLGVVMLTLGILIFTTLSVYIGTAVMLSLGVLFIAGGLSFVLLGILSHKSQILNCRLYAFAILSAAEKLISTSRDRSLRGDSDCLQKEVEKLGSKLEKQQSLIIGLQENERKLLALKDQQNSSDSEGMWSALSGTVVSTVGSWLIPQDRDMINNRSELTSINIKLSGLQDQVKVVEGTIEELNANIARSNRTLASVIRGGGSLHRTSATAPLVKKKSIRLRAVSNQVQNEEVRSSISIASCPLSEEDYQSCTED